MEDIIIIADDSEKIPDNKESTDNNPGITDEKSDSRKLSNDEIKEAENAVDYLCKLYKITISNETRKKINTAANAKCIITAIAALRTGAAVNEAVAAEDLPESVNTTIFTLYTSNDELNKKINEAADTVNNLKNSNDDIRQIFETEIKNSFEREKQATNALIEQYKVSLEAKDKTYTLIMRNNNDLKKANEKLNINTIHACIRKLLEEEYVKVAYIDYSGNVMSRYFMPTVSKGKYFSESYKDIIGSKKLILTSLIETETNIEELEQLENLIRKKKEELKE